jgi:MipA family protein
MNSVIRYGVLISTLWACSLSTTWAAEPTTTLRLPLWELGLGAAALRLPHYRGADQHHNWLLPVPYVIYRGEVFKADREGARAELFNSKRLDLDVSAALSAPTRSQDNRARQGMADLAPTFELGPNMNVHLAQTPTWRLDVRLPLRAVFSLQKNPQALGWSFTPNLNWDVKNVAGWKWGLQAGPQFGGRRLHGYFYDVNAQDARPGRSAYQAPGGFAGLQLTTALSRSYNNTWVGLFVRADHLGGARFASSPLVKQTSQASMGIAVAWVLSRSSTLVETPNSSSAQLGLD